MYFYFFGNRTLSLKTEIYCSTFIYFQELIMYTYVGNYFNKPFNVILEQ